MNRTLASVLFMVGGLALSYIGGKISAPIYEKERQDEIDERVKTALEKEINGEFVDVELDKNN